ncbi:putative membrane protein [Beggiatoa alba B18LD]|uniref:Putative membrane protein n=1 Tax=Beggiatoa alba B18LD TaxID=395493 RepID=I3CKL6_9GAMM|nr:RDD family protein [Beggiatoa alba]EIJ44159.1 putative membrane protein [Beggiatoa alba B18LD]
MNTPPLIDTTYIIETPEGVELTLHIAGPVVRAIAWFIDLCIRLLIYILLGNMLLKFGNIGVGLLLLMLFLGEWFYYVLFEVYAGGKTLGKRLLGIKVILASGAPVTWSASMTRNLLRVADFLPFLNALGLISMICTKNFQRLGDIAAQTIVIYQDKPIKHNALPNMPAYHLSYPLTLEEQQAIINFAERAQTFSQERADELASIIQPLIADDKNATQALYQIAIGLLGKK